MKLTVLIPIILIISGCSLFGKTRFESEGAATSFMESQLHSDVCNGTNVGSYTKTEATVKQAWTCK